MKRSEQKSVPFTHLMVKRSTENKRQLFRIIQFNRSIFYRNNLFSVIKLRISMKYRSHLSNQIQPVDIIIMAYHPAILSTCLRRKQTIKENAQLCLTTLSKSHGSYICNTKITQEHFNRHTVKQTNCKYFTIFIEFHFIKKQQKIALLAFSVSSTFFCIECTLKRERGHGREWEEGSYAISLGFI